MSKEIREEKVKMICVCGHNKLYHEYDNGEESECIGMMCKCKKFKLQKKSEDKQ